MTRAEMLYHINNDKPTLSMMPDYMGGIKIPFLHPDIAEKMNRIERIRTFISQSWGQHLTGGTPVNPTLIDEAGQLLKSLRREVEPYKLHTERLLENQRVKMLIEGLTR